VAGAFTLAANGLITGGEQDFVDYDPTTGQARPLEDTISSGTYATSADGNLTITLVTGDTQIGVNGNGTEILDATLISSQRARLMESDSSATGSGSMELQSSPATPSGAYAFNLSGSGFYMPNDDGPVRLASTVMGGILDFDGAGNVLPGSSAFDVNDSVTVAYLNQLFASGTVSVTPDSFGRVFLSLDPTDNSPLSTQPITLIGYIVGSSSIRLVETADSYGGILGGIALAQTGTFSNSSISGSSYIFGASGGRVTGTGSLEPLQLAGVLTLTADAGSSTSGTVSGTLNYNDFSNQDGPGGSPFTGDYTFDVVDPGRITLTNLAGGTPPFAFNLQFYLTGDGHALLISVDDNVIAGTGFEQTGPFSAATFDGGYALNVRRVKANSSAEDDGVGPVTADGVGTLGGFADINLDQTGTTADVPLAGKFTADATGIFTGSITGLDEVAGTADNFTFYVANGTEIIAIETDTSPGQIILGYFEAQQ
jgi:hypothetical protein